MKEIKFAQTFLKFFSKTDIVKIRKKVP